MAIKMTITTLGECEADYGSKEGTLPQNLAPISVSSLEEKIRYTLSV